MFAVLVRPVAPVFLLGELVGAGPKTRLGQPLHGQRVEGAVAFQRFGHGGSTALFLGRRADGFLVRVVGVEAEDGIAVGGFNLVSVYVVVCTARFNWELGKSESLGAITVLMILPRYDERDRCEKQTGREKVGFHFARFLFG